MTTAGPYDGNGVGRAWPLLAGERGHLALQAGEDPIEYLRTMHRCASPGGLLPEQVWDAAPIPGRFLFPGRPSGSAMPLLWSHAEFLKLLIARHDKRPVELLEAVRKRYGRTHAEGEATPAGATRRRRPRSRPGARCSSRTASASPCISAGTAGATSRNCEAEPLPFGLWGVAIGPDRYGGRSQLNFTRRYGGGWEGRDHTVAINAAAAPRVADEPAATAATGRRTPTGRGQCPAPRRRWLSKGCRRRGRSTPRRWSEEPSGRDAGAKADAEGAPRGRRRSAAKRQARRFAKEAGGEIERSGTQGAAAEAQGVAAIPAPLLTAPVTRRCETLS